MPPKSMACLEKSPAKSMRGRQACCKCASKRVFKMGIPAQIACKKTAVLARRSPFCGAGLGAGAGLLTTRVPGTILVPAAGLAGGAGLLSTRVPVVGLVPTAGVSLLRILVPAAGAALLTTLVPGAGLVTSRVPAASAGLGTGLGAGLAGAGAARAGAAFFGAKPSCRERGGE